MKTKLPRKQMFFNKIHLTKNDVYICVVNAQFRTEMFSPKRFKGKTRIAKYIGLASQITQSRQTLRDGPILKTGLPVTTLYSGRSSLCLQVVLVFVRR